MRAPFFDSVRGSLRTFAMRCVAACALAASLAAPQALAQRTLSVAPAAAADARIALVIGNSAYRDSPLRNPANDAADMARVLGEMGWKVTLRTNATQRQMKEAIRTFGNEIARGGVGLFYFAGHGIQYRGENYLVPIGADIARESHVEDEAVSARFVLAQMEEARNRANVVILDACRNNPFTRGFRSASNGLAQMDAAQGTLIAFATAPGSVAADGEGRNGVYTQHLLRHMRTPGLPVELMFKRVRNDVLEDTRGAQTPWESSSLRGSDLYFRPAAATAEAPAQQPPAPPPAPTPAPVAQGPDPAAIELAFWDSVRNSGNRNDLLAYLERYPSGQFAGLARSRIERDQQALLALATEPLRRFGPAPPGKTASGLPVLHVAAARALKDAVSTEQMQQLLALYRKDAESGGAEAQFSIGALHAAGAGAGGAAETIAWFRKAADQGYAPAHAQLGSMYARGNGVARNEIEALRWSTSGAQRGEAVARVTLAMLHEAGVGVPKNEAEALRIYREAAGTERWPRVYALTALRDMHREGRGTPKDNDEAKRFAQLAESDAPDPRSLKPVRTVTIAASASWTDTGVEVRPGDLLRVAAEGRWSMGLVCGTTGPDGAGVGFLCDGDFFNIGARGSSLIGRVGTDDAGAFPVGNGTWVRTAMDGRLYLRSYDGIPFDNTGSLKVTISRVEDF